MRKKILTMECEKCDLMKVNDDGKFTCKWGKGEIKALEPQKGKKLLHCNLKGK